MRVIRFYEKHKHFIILKKSTQFLDIY